MDPHAHTQSHLCSLILHMCTHSCICTHTCICTHCICTLVQIQIYAHVHATASTSGYIGTVCRILPHTYLRSLMHACTLTHAQILTTTMHTRACICTYAHTLAHAHTCVCPHTRSSMLARAHTQAPRSLLHAQTHP